MEYKVLVTDRITTAQREFKDAKLRLAVAKFGMVVYDAVYALTLNDKFAYQMSKEFEFDRILLSKEFTDDEKENIKLLSEQYDLIK